jgi:hypothetical protein
MLVTVVFDGVVEGETGLGGSIGRRIPLRRHASTEPERLLARFVSRTKGLHAVSWEDLLAATSSGAPDLASSSLMLDTASMRLWRKGTVVPFHVEPRPDRFGPGSTLFFLSEGSADAHDNDAVFELAVAPDGLRMAIGASTRGRSTAPPALEPLASLHSPRSFEKNVAFLPAILEAKDFWLWDYGIGLGKTKSYPFSLASVVPTGAPARLRIDLQGGSDTVANPDHHLRISLNGNPVAETSFDGMKPHSLAVDVPASILLEGANTLTIESLADTGATKSFVYLDRFSLDYPHALAAEAGSLEGQALTDGVVQAAGFAPGSVLIDLSGRLPQWLGRSRTALSFAAEQGHPYLAVSPEAFLRPQIRPVEVSSLRDTTSQADWILIAPREFLPAAQPLLDHRQAQGLAAMAVALEDIYDSFGFGEVSPEAIQSFLSFAYHHWQAPAPRYVFLLGDASSDPKGFITGPPRKDILPTSLVKSSFLWAPSDLSYASVNGDDLLPDLAVGRINANSLPEAQAALQKILDFENAHLSLDGKAVLVADNPDLAGDFEANLNDVASLLTQRPVQKLFLSQLGSQTRPAILDAFDQGPALVSYVGHGSQGLWASEMIFSANDIPLLAPQARQPLVLTMTCSNGYFTHPWSNSLAEDLTLAPDKGAIAAFSPTGLSIDSAAHLYHRALVTQLESGHHHRIGDVVLAAQAVYAQSGAFPELLAIYHLFGDPALEVR